MRFIFGSVLIALLAACTTSMGNYYTQTVQSWRGGNINTLHHRWGRPDSRYSGPNRSVVYVYNTNIVSRTSSALNANGANRGPMSHTCSAVFTVDRSGTIIDTKVLGKNCYASAKFAQRMSDSR